MLWMVIFIFTCNYFFVCFFFFFQAEDGIRDYKVTGVQTCALPIYERAPGEGRAGVPDGAVRRGPRHRRAGGRRRDEGTRPGGRLDHEAVRGGPREGATRGGRHAVLGEAVREGPGAVPGEEVSPGDCDG